MQGLVNGICIYLSVVRPSSNDSGMSWTVLSYIDFSLAMDSQAPMSHKHQDSSKENGEEIQRLLENENTRHTSVIPDQYPERGPTLVPVRQSGGSYPL